MRLCGNREDSKDLIHQTFVKIIEKVRAKRGIPISCFHGYFFKSLSLNYYENQRKKLRRAEKRNSAVIIDIEENKTTDRKIDEFIQKNTLDQILSLVDNEEQRRLFEQYLNGYSYDEIAKQNQLTKGQVRGLLFRTKKSLKLLKVNILSIIDG